MVGNDKYKPHSLLICCCNEAENKVRRGVFDIVIVFIARWIIRVT